MPATVTDRHLVTPRDLSGPVVVRFGEEYVWSYHPARDGEAHRDGWLMRWPEAMLPHLVGTGRVRVGDPSGERLCFDETLTFGGSDAPLALRDRQGRPVAVDKWGKLARVFSGTGEGVLAELVTGTARAIEELRREAGVEAHVNYGALLGAVRDGHLIGHDNDTDLAYLSRHEHPVDVILESYRIERVMRRLGWKLVRMSAADVKLYLPLSDGTEAHVDIFGAFYVGDTFYLLGDTSGPLPRDVITPLGEVELEGVRLAAPRDPEAMLAFLYGDQWRVPDPAFSRAWPHEGIRRLDGWLRGQRQHVKEWNQLLFKPGNVALEESAFAAWVDARLPAGEPVVDVGSGNGRDTRFFARDRPVAAYDFAGTALRKTDRKVADVRPGQLVGALPLNDFRAVVLAGAELARTERPHHVYARHLLGCLDEVARHHLWRLAGMALRRGGTISLEFAATGTDAPATPAGLVRRLDPELVAAELRERGFEVLETEVGAGTDVLDHPDPSVARLHARWPTPQEHR